MVFGGQNGYYLRSGEAVVSAYAPVYREVRRTVVGACVLGVFFLGLVGFAAWATSAMQQQEMQQQSVLQTEQMRRDQLVDDLANVEQHIQRYKDLQAQGLIGEGQRAHWMQHLGDLAAQLQLYGGFKATLDTAQEFARPEVLETGAAKIYFYDLAFEVSPVMETDVFDLVGQYRPNAKGRFRIQQCTWQDPKEPGMLAKCKLRFFTLAPQVPSTGEGAQ
ncbi:MAG: hypothetical protein RIR09_180 [Pseudomonadota bacterium]